MLTASTADLWVPCSLAGPLNCHGAGAPVPAPRAIATPDGIEDDSTAARREGTAAHWVAQQVLRGDAHDCMEMAGETAPNGWNVDAEMCRHVQGYVDVVRSVGGSMHAETPAQYGDLVAGRSDAVATTGDYVLHVFQLKYGWKPVEVFQNWNLLTDALLWFNGAQHAAVMLTVVQPRPWHPDGPARTWTLDASTFNAHAAFILHRAKHALAPDPIATPGEQCKKCAGIGRCYAAQKTIYAHRDAEEDRRVVNLGAADLADELARMRFIVAMAESRLTALEAEADGRIRSGEDIPGYQLEDWFGQPRVTMPPDHIKLLTGVTAVKEVPMTAADLADEGVPPHLIKLITTKPHKGRRLVPLTKKHFDRAFKDHPAITPETGPQPHGTEDTTD